MNILVLGANGMAGHTISLYFKEQGYVVTGHTTSPYDVLDNNIVGNAFDTESFKAMLLDGNYDAVIN